MDKSECVKRVEAAKGTDDFYDTAYDTISEVISHLDDFCRSDDVWDSDTVKDICYDIGEIIYDEKDLDTMKQMYDELHGDMGPIAARYLECFWNGVGGGAWRS